MPRVPWSSRDVLAAQRGMLSVLALTTLSALPAVGWSEASSMSGSSSSGFSSSSSGSRFSSSSSWSEEDGTAQWNSVLRTVQGAILMTAEEPFTRPKIRFAIGPEVYSFARIAREYGSTTSCKATFRFELRHLSGCFVASSPAALQLA